MWRKARAAGLLLAMVWGLAVLAGGPAWAAPELRLSPANGPAGSTITVDGSGFDDADVELHWDGESGRLLRTAPGPEFSVTAEVPEDATPKFYRVVAVVRTAGGVSTSSASFQVTPPPEVVEPGTTVPTTTVPTTTRTTATTTPPTTIPEERVRGALNGRSTGVDGGVGPSMADTADAPAIPGPGSGSASSADVDAAVAAAIRTADAAVAAANAAVGAVAGLAPAAPGGAPTTTPAGGAQAGVPGQPAADGAAAVPSSPASGNRSTALAPGEAGDAGGEALGSQPTRQSGAVRSPAVLFVGLGLVLAGGIVLAVRSRRRPVGDTGT